MLRLGLSFLATQTRNPCWIAQSPRCRKGFLPIVSGGPNCGQERKKERTRRRRTLQYKRPSPVCADTSECPPSMRGSQPQQRNEMQSAQSERRREKSAPARLWPCAGRCDRMKSVLPKKRGKQLVWSCMCFSSFFLSLERSSRWKAGCRALGGTRATREKEKEKWKACSSGEEESKSGGGFPICARLLYKPN